MIDPITGLITGQEKKADASRMKKVFQFDYYYGMEAEQFSFYRVPRLLIKDRRFRSLSNDAKLLYGLALDRLSLSMKNGWIDEKNRVYIIYTIEDIMEDLGCGKDKAIKVLAELDSKKGIGLIEKKRRGFGKPDIIYVKNFVLFEEDLETKEDSNDEENIDAEKVEFTENVESKEVESAEITKAEEAESKDLKRQNPRSRKSQIQEVGKADFKKSEKPTSRSRKNRPQEVGKTDPNYIKYNKTNMNYMNHINHINPIGASGEKKQGEDMIDGDVGAYMKIIKENIEYDHHMKYDSINDRELYDELYELICDVVCVKRSTIRIGGEEYPHELVKSKFLKLRSSHLEYVINCMKDITTKISNIRAYMITALYNAPNTMNHYYQQEVQHDLFGLYGN